MRGDHGPRRRPGPGVPPLLTALRALLVVAGALLAAWSGPVTKWLAPLLAADDGEEREDGAAESGVYLPTDRLMERRLDFASRLVADARWSDAATLLDEILAADRDAFFRPDADTATWESTKVAAARMVGALPPEGRTAYELQFRARAERMLQEAITADDRPAIAAVARRWLNTPAGRQATLLSAIGALDDGQPLAAAAWLDRLDASGATEFEPTLSVMRAWAWHRAGDAGTAAAILEKARTVNAAATRIGGRETSVSFAPGGGLAWLAGAVGGSPDTASRTAREWVMHRGDPSRNALADASRPLLVPRFRVPLTRHPDETKWLEERRRRSAEQESPLLPAATPLAVNGTVVLHTAMGLLAVDFETGKRLWLQTGGAAAPVADGEEASDDDELASSTADISRHRMLAPVFDDATSGNLASDGRLVFAVESHPDAVMTPHNGPMQMRMQMQMQMQGPDAGGAGSWSGGNFLAAYDLADSGRLRWRLPAAGESAPRRPAWTLGAPLPVGDRLFVLVEESGGVRLDVLDAATGSLVWNQPLAELDEEARVDNRDNHSRRIAGLSPALSEGVLVCPTGAGAVVAVDLATRTLLWAYNYPVSPGAGDTVEVAPGVRVNVRQMRNGRAVVVNNGGAALFNADRVGGRWIDSCPVLSNGKALLAPGDSDHLHCVDLRTGRVAWKRPRQDGLFIAGVVDRRVLVVGRREVEALSIDDGDAVWSSPLAGETAAISGRCLLDQDRMFVPLDTPEVVEIELAKGTIVGRSPGRGGAVPGNLVAYRGEVLSQAADSLDVFHQTAPLQSRIETASRRTGQEREDPSLLMWRGQLRLDRGDVAAGLQDVQAAMLGAPDRFPPDMLAESIVFAMEHDTSLAGTMWPSLVQLDSSPAIVRRGLRCAIDGLLKAGNVAEAWQACRQLLDDPRWPPAADLVADGRDPLLKVRESRWIQGRIGEIVARGGADVGSAVDAFIKARLAALRQRPEGAPAETSHLAALDFLVECFGRHPGALEARRERLSLLAMAVDDRSSAGDAPQPDPLRRELALLDLLHTGAADDIRRAEVDLTRIRSAWEAPPPGQGESAWPVGRVEVTGGDDASGEKRARTPIDRTVPVAIESNDDSLIPDMRVAFDMRHGGLVIHDGIGRRLGAPLTWTKRGFGAFGINPASTSVSVVGRIAVIRAGEIVTAYAIGGPSAAGKEASHRPLWSFEGDATRHLVRGHLGRIAGGGAFLRNGMPIGMRIVEPRPRDGSQPESPAPVSIAGVPIVSGRSLQLRDPISGRVIWERHRLPEADSIFGDHDHLCICPTDGRGSAVISMATGQQVRTGDLPSREERLLHHGRLVFATTRGPGTGDAVGLDVIDPLDMNRVRIGTFSGNSRTAQAGDGLAILEPSGSLTVVDLPGSRVAFTTKLPEMPEQFDHLMVMPWQDRYLVIAGRPATRQETGLLERVGTIGPLPSHSPTPDHQLTGAIWAVDRRDGRLLWPVPATVLQHYLLADQPHELPIMTFARQINPRRGGERPRLSVLCLDKRTGAAVHADDAILLTPNAAAGFSVVGAPDRHLVSLVPYHPSGHPINLRFTGEPLAPQPPFQGGSRPVAAGNAATELEYWLRRVLPIPSPF